MIRLIKMGAGSREAPCAQLFCYEKAPPQTPRSRGEDATHKWALDRAREWDMEDEYWAAIRDGCTPLEALEEWDLL